MRALKLMDELRGVVISSLLLLQELNSPAARVSNAHNGSRQSKQKPTFSHVTPNTVEFTRKWSIKLLLRLQRAKQVFSNAAHC